MAGIIIRGNVSVCFWCEPCESGYFMGSPSHTAQQQQILVYLIIIYTLGLNLVVYMHLNVPSF